MDLERTRVSRDRSSEGGAGEKIRRRTTRREDSRVERINVASLERWGPSYILE